MLQWLPKKLVTSIKIRRERKRDALIQPIKGPPKRPQTSADSKRLTMLAAIMISDKYKKVHDK